MTNRRDRTIPVEEYEFVVPTPSYLRWWAWTGYVMGLPGIVFVNTR